MPIAQNVLFVGLDDVGHADTTKTRSILLPTSASTPRTPTIDGVADNGIYFVNYYGQPSCISTRAAWFTGRWPFRSGAVSVFQPEDTRGIVSQTELFSPEYLTAQGIATGLFGKWHLSDAVAGGDAGPILAGFQRHVGSPGNFLLTENYTNWRKVIDGVDQGIETNYATSEIVDEAITWINARNAASERWFASIQFNAPHSPYHEPPAALHTFDSSPANGFGNTPPFTDEYPAMLEALDTELARLLTAIGIDYNTTLVIVASDNGTPNSFVHEPITSGVGAAKGSVDWAGTCVPMHMRGAGVVGTDRRIDGVAASVDLLPTICEVLGVNARELAPTRRPLDGVSLLDLMQDRAESVRDYAFSERRDIDGDLTEPERYGCATQGYLFTRRVQNDPPDEMYNTRTDPEGAINLLDAVANPAGLTDAQQGLAAAMSARIDELRFAKQNQPVSHRFAQ